MRSYGAWLGRLAMAGVCLGVAGCGGGDVPNPDSDPSAANDRTIAKGPAAPDAAPTPAKPDAPAKVDEPAKTDPSGPSAPATAPTPGSEAEKPAAPNTEAPADSQKPVTPPSGDASGTDEMLRTAPSAGAAPAPGTPGPSAPAPGGPSAPAPGGPSAPAPGGPSAPAPGGPSAPAPGRDERAPGGGATPSTPGPPLAGPGGAGTPVVPGAPGGDGRPSSDGRPSTDGRPNAPSGGGVPGGGSGGGGSGNTTTNRRTYQYPNGTVSAFLAALKNKNKDQLSEATAKRASTEAVEKHQKIFSEIIDGSLSDEELNEMANAFDGFQVASVLPAKSTGRIGVLIGKQGKTGDYLQRTVTCRLEEGIWKVVDISQLYDFKRTGTVRRRR